MIDLIMDHTLAAQRFALAARATKRLFFTRPVAKRPLHALLGGWSMSAAYVFECGYGLAISNFGECPDYLDRLLIPLVDFFYAVKITAVEEVNGQRNDSKAC